MAVCKKISIERPSVCMGSFDSVIKLYKREIQSASVGEISASEGFTLVIEMAAGVQTLGTVGTQAVGTRRFSGVNIGSDTTHLFLLPYAPNFESIEVKNHFIEYGGKFFTIESITNLNEANLTLMYQSSERGSTLREAAEA